jgi:hypothetical protein
MSERRKRGRPIGSGKKDDPTLIRVAGYMIRDASLKPTTAMRRVIRDGRNWSESDDTLIRRLQAKWSKHGTLYLDRARRELEATQNVTLADVLATWASSQNFHQNQFRMNAAFTGLGETLLNIDRNIRQSLASPEFMKVAKALGAFNERLHAISKSPELIRMMSGVDAYQRHLSVIAGSAEFKKWTRLAESFKPIKFHAHLGFHSPSKRSDA